MLLPDPVVSLKEKLRICTVAQGCQVHLDGTCVPAMPQLLPGQR